VLLLGLSAALGASWFVWDRSAPAGIPEESQRSAPLACGEDCAWFRVAFTGDTLIGDAARKRIKKSGYRSVLQRARPLLAGADFVLVNAEAPLTNLGRRWDPSGKGWSYNTRKAAAEQLAWLGVDAIGIANNHGWDRGALGVADTLRSGQQAGLGVVGAGLDEARAWRPLIVPTPHGSIGVVAVHTGRLASPPVGAGQPGVAVWDPARVDGAVAAAREAGAEHLVAYVHWGRNYAPIKGRQRRLAHALVDAGFDLIVGHGAHTVQPVGRIRGVPVLYSLGNFVFNTPGRFGKLSKPGFGMVAHAWLGADGFAAVELRCLMADNQVTKYKARPCTDVERGPGFAELGPAVEVHGKAAWIGR